MVLEDASVAVVELLLLLFVLLPFPGLAMVVLTLLLIFASPPLDSEWVLVIKWVVELDEVVVVCKLVIAKVSSARSGHE